MSKSRLSRLATALAAIAALAALSLLSGCAVPATGGIVSVHVQGATHPIEPDCQCSAS